MPVAKPVYIDLLMEEIKSLPESCAVQVFDYVSYLKAKAVNKEGCPICAKLRDPVTGEPLYNAETRAAIEEGDAILRGEIPAKRYNSLEEMLVDLDTDD